MSRFRLLNSKSLLILLCGLACSSIARAQYRGYPRTSGGITIGNSPVKDNPTYAASWQGGMLRVNGVDMSLMTNHFRLFPRSTVDSLKGSSAYIGGLVWLPNVRLGKKSNVFRGVQLQPSFLAHVTRRTLGSWKSYGVNIAPSIGLFGPLFFAELRLNTGINFKGGPEGMQRFVFQPTLALCIDGLWEVFDPEDVSGGTVKGTTVNYSKDYQKTGSTYENGRFKDEYIEYDVATYTRYAYKSMILDCGPFVALAPKYSYSRRGYCGNTNLYGLMFSGHYGFLGFDLQAEFGTVGFASSWRYKPSIDEDEPDGQNEIMKDDYRFSGTIAASRYYLSGHIDLLGLIGGRGQKSGPETPMNRINVTVGFGYASIDGKNAEFIRPEAEGELNVFLEEQKGLINPNSYVDARTFKSGMIFTYGLAMEFGAIGCRFEGVGYQHARLANVGTFSVYYKVPFIRLIYGKKED